MAAEPAEERMVAQTSGPKRRLPWYGWAGIVALAAGEGGLLLGVPAVQILFYCIAWWSYILIADALVWRRRGNSLLRSRPWEFLVLAFWSIPLWNLFELLNFRLQNWFYINVPTDFVQGAVLSFFAYATVLPGIFETYDLLRAYGVMEQLRMRPWRIGPAGLRLSIAIGAGMLVAPLVWPRYAYPLVWGFAVFLLDPLCYLSRRTPSFLAQFERGDPRPFVRLLLAGLICGGLWEFWNFWAYTKWVYTVPFFEDSKWFEMPPLGFLGFPPFALECYVLINTLNLLRPGRGWEASTPGPGAPRGLAISSAVVAVLFNLSIYAGIDRFTVESTVPRLAELEGLSLPAVQGLSRLGIETPPALLRRTMTGQHRSALARELGLSEAEVNAAREAARLADLKGLGARHANSLRRLGIRSVEELGRVDPVTLRARWDATVEAPAPPLPRIKVWVRAAREGSGDALRVSRGKKGNAAGDHL
jgi:hypothetical protein